MVGTQVTQQLQLLENGNADLHVALQSISGDDAGDFTVFAGLPGVVTDGGGAKRCRRLYAIRHWHPYGDPDLDHR
ncbi:MAG: hypothetical protein R2932_42780 [Caldilineaceae bacterium]